MREKEQEKILHDLKEVVEEILLDGFKNRMLRVVDTVEQIQILNYEIIQDEDDRDQISVANIEVQARVFVIFGEGAKSLDNILLKNQKPLRFRYSKEIDNYELDLTSVAFFDAT